MTLMAVMCLTAGCGEEEKTTKVYSELKEAPILPAFVTEDETEVEEELVLPSAYNYVEENRMPMLRNQGDTNSCWAFAALSALESSMDEDTIGPYSADHLINSNPFGKSFEEGGSYIVTMAYLLAWEGPVAEIDDPFDGDSPEMLEEIIHVQEIRQSEPKDYEAIKRFVYLYGGVESALYVDFQGVLTESSYYNETYNSYCYQGEEISNHDVVIVGWDDHYPAENFVGDVTQDGAFLCLNSWGETFGNAGTFYVSYEDVNIGGYGVAYSRIDSVDNYDKIYQSDLCGYTAQIGYQQDSAWFSSVYTAEEALQVRAAGFYATGANSEYEIYMIPKFRDESSFVFKRLIATGELEDAGFYTIDFPEAVNVEAGDDFAVVVKITTENAEYPVAIECPVEGLSENADISDGRSYLSFQGNLWEHVEATKEYNICLKAYADLQ